MNNNPHPSSILDEQSGIVVSDSDALYRAILYSIGEGIITTDALGRIIHVNPVAEQLIGWTEKEVRGKHLRDVVTILDEKSAMPVDNPVEKVLRENSVVGLTNHSLLVSRDGRKIPIADSASPIRNSRNKIIGVVFVIRDQSEDREAQRRLRESMELLEKIQARAKIGGWEYEPATGRCVVSKEFGRLHGFDCSAGFITLEELCQSVHPADRHRFRSMVCQAVQSGTASEFEYRTNPELGAERIIHTHIECVAGEEGSVQRVCGTSQDMTEFRLAEMRLAEERSLLRTVIDHLPDAVYVKDREGRKILANPSDLSNIGKTAGEVLGRTDFEVFPAEIAEQFDLDDRHVMERGEGVINREELLRNWKGDTRWLLTSKIPWRDQHGTIIGIVGIGRDITDRKRAEEELRKREELYRTTLYSIGDGVITTNAHGCVEQMNPIAEKLTGWKEADAKGRKLEEVFYIINEESRRTVENPVEKVLRQGVIVGLANHTLLVARDGTERPIADSAAPIRDQSGSIIGVVLVFRDQSAEREAEMKLTHERNLLRTVIDNIPDAVYAKDRQGRKILANPQDLRNIGRSAEEVMGKTDFEVYPAEIAERFAADDAVVIQEKRSIIGREEILVNEKNERRWLLTSKLPWFDDEGNVIGIVGIGHDITERKLHEQALQDREELFRATLYSIGDGVITTDARGCIERMNPIAEELAGWTEKEARGLKLEEVFRIVNEESRKTVTNPVDRVLREGVIVGLANHTLLIARTGKETPIADSAAPIRDGNGAIIGVVLVFRDQTAEREAERKLMESEERYRTLVENAPVGIYRISPDGTLLMANPRLRDILDYGTFEKLASSAAGNEWFARPGERREFIDRLKECGEVWGFESAWRRRSGELIYVRENAKAVYDTNGTLLYVEGTVEDITERKRAEEALVQERILLRTVIDNIPAAVYVKDLDGRKVLSNRTDLDIIGKQEEEVIGKTDFDVYPERLAEEFRRDDLNIIQTGKGTYGREICIIDRDNRAKWLLTSKIPLRNKEDQIVGIVGIGLDITERKQALEALRKSEERYREFFENDLTADYITTVSGRITMFNPAFLRVFGFGSPAEVRTVNEAVLWPSSEKRSAFLTLLREKRSLSYYPLELRRRDGSPLHAIANIVGIFGSNGSLRKVRMYLFDETPKKLLEEQFRQAQKLESLGTLAGGIAHDFNNILSIIMGYSSLIDPQKTTPEQLARSLDAIDKATERGAAIVNQLLTLARKTEVVAQTVNANDIVSEVTRLLHETFPKTVEVITRLHPDLPLIVADTTQIHQVLLNLCVNARDAMHGKGLLTIVTESVTGRQINVQSPVNPDDEFVLIQVSDTGEGIEEAIRDRIFDPFFTTKKAGEGTGLGLSLVYRIVDNHNGFITMESEVGVGTTFNIYFPVQKDASDTNHIKQSVPETVLGGSETVLLIEDEELLREFVKTTLEEKGYTVLTAPDGYEGLNVYAARKQDIDLVVTDLGLPKLSGDEVFEKIKSMDPKAKIILASGFIDPGVKGRVRRAGARYFIRKPYARNELLQMVRQVLDN